MLGGVVRGHALHGGQDDIAGPILGLLAGGAFDRPGDLDRIVLGLFLDRLDEHGLGVLGRHPRDTLEGGDLLALRSGQVLAGLVEFALAIEQLPVAQFDHLGSLVELFVALQEASLQAGEFVALGPGFVLGLGLHAELLVLRLEDQFLLASAGLGLDAASLGLRGLHRLGGPDAAREYAKDGSDGGGHEGHRHDERCVHLRHSSRPVNSCDRRSHVS